MYIVLARCGLDITEALVAHLQMGTQDVPLLLRVKPLQHSDTVRIFAIS